MSGIQSRQLLTEYRYAHTGDTSKREGHGVDAKIATVARYTRVLAHTRSQELRGDICWDNQGK